MKTTATIISGSHAGERIQVTRDTNQVTLGVDRYTRIPDWMCGSQVVFAPPLLSYSQLMELLVESYAKLMKLEKELI